MKKDWVAHICDRIEQHVQRTKGEGAAIYCASGISPSGPIHLGNLREVMTVHLVAEELLSRGRQVTHLHFWDDFDRLRKIPAGIPPAYEAYIGYPLSDIPDPFDTYDSYATRYMIDFTQSLARLGIFPHFVRQSVAYRSGKYSAQIKEALARRGEIFDILEILRHDELIGVFPHQLIRRYRFAKPGSPEHCRSGRSGRFGPWQQDECGA